MTFTAAPPEAPEGGAFDPGNPVEEVIEEEMVQLPPAPPVDPEDMPTLRKKKRKQRQPVSKKTLENIVRATPAVTPAVSDPFAGVALSDPYAAIADELEDTAPKKKKRKGKKSA